MFALSTWEILIILVVALMFIGPDQLPKVARKLGEGMRQVRGAMSRMDNEVRRTIREATAEDALEEDERRRAANVHDDDASGDDPVPPTPANAAPPATAPLPHNTEPTPFSPPGRTPPAGAVARKPAPIVAPATTPGPVETPQDVAAATIAPVAPETSPAAPADNPSPTNSPA